MTTETTFGGWLRQQRRRLDWTQVELAHQVGYSVATIRKLEREELRPSKRLAEQVAQALEVAVTQHASLVNFARATPTSPLEPDTPPLDEPKHSNLPAQLTPFFGRTAEIVELTQYLTNPTARLITIVGAGGMGKTRLAQEVAHSLYEHKDQPSNAINPKFPDGVYFVALAPLRVPEHIAPAIAEAINLRFQASNRPPQQQLLDYLRPKQMLLILDNFEHLQAGAELILVLLQACPGLRLLVTSREHLRLNSETLFVLESMALPATATLPDVLTYSAIQLFVETACRLRPKFTLTPANAPAILQICQLVGGMPLGIILAAAWIEVLSPAEIVTELSQGFDFLAADLRDLPERQRSMRAMLSQSWQRLTDAEHAVFMRLAVFGGGFTRLAAQSVAGADLRMLNTLVNKSLVQCEPSGRYTIHELLRLFALERLQECGEEAETRQHHAHYYLELSEAADALLHGQQQVACLHQLDADLDNLRAAFQWFLPHEPIQAVALAGALKTFWSLRCYYQEGRHWFAQALTIPEIPTPLRARVLLATGGLANRQGQNVESLALVEESILLYRQLGDIEIANLAEALRVCGWIYDELHQHQSKIAAFEESLRLCQQMGNPTKTALLLASLVYAHGAQKLGYAQASRTLQESVTLLYTSGDINALLFSLSMQGDVAIQFGHYPAAQATFDEILVLAQDAGLQHHVAWAWQRRSECKRQQNDAPGALSDAQTGWQLGQVLGDQDMIMAAWRVLGDAQRANREYVIAANCYRQALSSCLATNNRNQAIHCWIGCASIALTHENGEVAAQLLGAAQKAVEQLNPFLAMKDLAELTDLQAHARMRLGEEIFARAWLAGQVGSFEQVVVVAQSL